MSKDAASKKSIATLICNLAYPLEKQDVVAVGTGPTSDLVRVGVGENRRAGHGRRRCVLGRQVILAQGQEVEFFEQADQLVAENGLDQVTVA